MRKREHFLFFYLALYAFPLAIVTLYASSIFSSFHSFRVLSLGIFLAICGSLILFMVYRQPPAAILPEPLPEIPQALQQEPVQHAFPEADYVSAIEELKGQMAGLVSESQKLLQEGQEREHLIAESNKNHNILQRKLDEIMIEYERFQDSAKDQQEQMRLLLHEHQLTITEQRDSLEKKQQQISQQEGQIRDLQYEIKTLMDLDEKQSIIRFPSDRFNIREMDNFSLSVEEEEMVMPIAHAHTPAEALQQLKRCLDIAQKITGSYFVHNRSSRLRDLPVENTALEMRRLFDNLRSESQATILLYSPKESKLLFVNNPIKSLVGWTPEKFVQQFPELLADGAEAWKSALSRLAFKNETEASLWICSKSGQQVPINCQLGLIPTGSFRHYVLGVLYPAK